MRSIYFRNVLSKMPFCRFTSLLINILIFPFIVIAKNDYGKFKSVKALKIRKSEEILSENDISEIDTTFSPRAMSRFRTS